MRILATGHKDYIKINQIVQQIRKSFLFFLPITFGLIYDYIKLLVIVIIPHASLSPTVSSSDWNDTASSINCDPGVNRSGYFRY